MSTQTITLYLIPIGIKTWILHKKHATIPVRE